MANTRSTFGSIQGCSYPGNQWPKQEELLVLYRGVFSYPGNQWPNKKSFWFYTGVFISREPVAKTRRAFGSLQRCLFLDREPVA